VNRINGITFDVAGLRGHLQRRAAQPNCYFGAGLYEALPMFEPHFDFRCKKRGFRIVRERKIIEKISSH